jgi:hypothetical protein
MCGSTSGHTRSCGQGGGCTVTENQAENGEEGHPWPSGRYRCVVGTVPVCEDCGAMVTQADRDTHDRFHAIMNHQARAIGVLVASHVGERPHSKYDVLDRIGPNPAAWIGHAELQAFAESLPDDPIGGTGRAAQ